MASSTDQIFSTGSRRRFGLPTSSTVAAAGDALEMRGILTRGAKNGGIDFDSPFGRLWVEREVLSDVPPAG